MVDATVDDNAELPISLDRGWVCMPRGVLNTEVFANEGLLKVFLWCWCKATHDTYFASASTGRGFTQVALSAGQFVFGRFVAKGELSMEASTIVDRMKKLERMGLINIQPNTHYSIVTVCHWSAYQHGKPEDQQATRHPTDNHPTHTTTKQHISSLSEKSSNRSPATKKRTAKPTRSFTAEGIQLPAPLDTSEVRRSLADWLTFKGPHAFASAMGAKPLEDVCKRYAQDGPQALIDDIETAMANEWKGFYFREAVERRRTETSKGKTSNGTQRHPVNSAARIRSDEYSNPDAFRHAEGSDSA